MVPATLAVYFLTACSVQWLRYSRTHRGLAVGVTVAVGGVAVLWTLILIAFVVSSAHSV